MPDAVGGNGRHPGLGRHEIYRRHRQFSADRSGDRHCRGQCRDLFGQHQCRRRRDHGELRHRHQGQRRHQFLGNISNAGTISAPTGITIASSTISGAIVDSGVVTATKTTALLSTARARSFRNPNVGLRTLDEWLRDQSIAVVPRCFAQPDDVHDEPRATRPSAARLARLDAHGAAQPLSRPTAGTSAVPRLQLVQHVGVHQPHQQARVRDLVASRSSVSGVTSSPWLQTAVVANLGRSRRWCAQSP